VGAAVKGRFPGTLKHRREKATIYGKSRSYPYYRLAYRVTGKRRVVSFAKYAEARAEGERVIRELAEGWLRAREPKRGPPSSRPPLQATSIPSRGRLASDDPFVHHFQPESRSWNGTKNPETTDEHGWTQVSNRDFQSPSE
jgi:hypothetical protein